MKSRVPLLNFKGSIAILILVIGTIAAALVPDHSTATTVPAAEAVGARGSFTKVLHSRGERLPFYLYDAFVSTDKPDYAPGQIVHITGGGFAPGESVQVVIDYLTTAVPVKFRSESQSFSPPGTDPSSCPPMAAAISQPIGSLKKILSAKPSC